MATDSTQTSIHDPERLYNEYIEDEVDRSGDLILAARQDGRGCDIPTWQRLSNATDSSAIRALLQALAYNFQANDSWGTLGLSRLEGPKPNVLLLCSRRDVALKIIDSCSTSLSEAAQEEVSSLKAKLNRACDDCCSNLETIARERKCLKGIGRSTPRWMEPSFEMLSYLQAQVPPHSRVALHLSNLNNTELRNTAGISDVFASRQLHSQLCGPQEEIERALASWGEHPLITWAPIDNGQLLKVAAAARNLFATRAGQAPLVLVVPFDPYPAFEKVSDITDIWDHPLLHDKWQDLLVDANFLIPPSRIVVSGTVAPIHAHKCLALFTLGVPRSPATRRLTAWRPKIFSFSTGPVINIDIPWLSRIAVKNIVSTMGLPAVSAIDQPRASLGSTRESPRATIQIHLLAGQLSPLHMEALLKWLQNALEDFQAIVGVLSTMASPTAMLLDCMAADAGHIHGDLCWSALVMSPRLVSIETRSNVHTWTTSLTTAWNGNPNTSGIKLRYRPSSQIKQAFAHVEATSADIAAVRARKGRSSNNPSLQDPPTLQATISMPLGTCGPLEQWLPVFMDSVAVTNCLSLQRSTTENGLDVHRWRAIRAYDGSWTGKVVVQLANQQELRQLHASLHGMGIEIQQHLAGISVDSLHIDLASQTTQQQSA